MIKVLHKLTEQQKAVLNRPLLQVARTREALDNAKKELERAENNVTALLQMVWPEYDPKIHTYTGGDIYVVVEDPPPPQLVK